MTSRLRTLGVLALTAALLALFLKNADLARVWAEIRRADLRFVLLATASTLAAYPLRGVRWVALLRPLGRVPYGLAVRTTVIGFGASVVLPARAGEFIRPYLLARREGLSATAVFATIVIERVLDLSTVLLLLGAALLVFDPGLAARDPASFAALRAGGLVAALAAVGTLVTLMALAAHPERVSRTAARVELWLPRRLAAGLERVVHRFAEGLAVVRQPWRLLDAALWSVPVWFVIAAGVWSTTQAFHMGLPYSASFLVIAALVIGVSVPTPGAIGGFHAAFQIAVTRFYGIPNDRAVGAAIVLHAVSFLPVAVLGALFMVREGVSPVGVRVLVDGGAGAPVSGEAEAHGEVSVLRPSR